MDELTNAKKNQFAQAYADSQNNTSQQTATAQSATAQTASQKDSTPTPTTMSGTAEKNASPLAGNPSDRTATIHNMYENQIEANKQKLMSAYNQNMANAEAKKENINKNFDEQRNAVSAEYEKNRRNNNIQAANNGLNTGTGSQMQLAQSNAYQSNLSRLGASEATLKAEADRDIYNLKVNLQNDIAALNAQGRYQETAALLDEYNTQYKNASTEAAALAQYGDFSGWAKVVGAEEAAKMQEAWSYQNPDQAIATGLIDEDKYFELTGKHSKAYNKANSGGYGGASYGLFGQNGYYNGRYHMANGVPVGMVSQSNGAVDFLT